MAESIEYTNGFGTATISNVVTSNGTTSSFSSSRFTSIAATIDISNISGANAVIAITLEESDDGIIWASAFNPIRSTATGNQRLKGTKLSSRYFRFSWIVSGTTPSITFNITVTLKVDPSINSPLFKVQTDTYTGISTGVRIDTTALPLSKFSLQVTATGAIAAWSIVLEGSLDGINFSQIARHSETTGSGTTIFPGANASPCLYFRTRCTGFTLGLGTNIIATVLGIE